MYEIAERLLAARADGRRFAVATAISIQGSAPRTVGTSMAFDGDAVIGSIAGGCVEGALIEVCAEVLADGVPQTVEYGVSDETAFSVGLTCGGQLRIRVELLTDALAHELEHRSRRATIVRGLRGDHERRVAALLDSSLSTGLTRIDCDGEELEVFVEVAASPARLIVFGAMEFSVALAGAAAALGYRVTVCDPRPLFATSARFPAAELVVAWPTVYLAGTEVDARTVICVLSHDARFDAELVALALSLPVGYVGAMGSRTTHDRRVASLRERGVTDDALARLHSPIGLDIGASTPEETAISILAEVLASRTDTTALPLTVTTGAIHSAPRVPA